MGMASTPSEVVSAAEKLKLGGQISLVLDPKNGEIRTQLDAIKRALASLNRSYEIQQTGTVGVGVRIRRLS